MAAPKFLELPALILLLAAAALRPTLGVVTVHVVPHTHDDVGWLKTVDQYFVGANNTIQHANVRMILDTVMQALLANPERKFTYVEMAFFQRWWREQTPLMKQMVRGFVERGQLSFANGGWCMHDEAAPYYLDMIDQTTLGHRFLMEELGVAPKVGWQLDPFGHSATQAALLSAEVGFTGLFFGRVDYQDLEKRVKDSAAEFIWRASPSLGKEAQVFAGLTGSYSGNYGPPAGFNWDIFGADEPVQNDPDAADYNVASRVDDFVARALEQAAHTRGDHVMFTMGSDFQYEAAFEWFVNLDKIIKHVNADGRVQAMYSTPEAYTDAKAQETAVRWPLKTDDFFPYADAAHQFWTGYFTSRPAMKRYIRDSSAFLQTMKQMGAVTHTGHSSRGLVKLEQALGINQHHDAVSGTAKQHATFDYAKKLAEGRLESLEVATGALRKLGGIGASDNVVVCDLRNVSLCAPTQGVQGNSDSVELLLWNGLGQARTELVELPVGSCTVSVLGPDGKEVESQVVQALPSITNYGEAAGGSEQTLVFLAEVPPMGFKRFKVIGQGASRCAVRERRDAKSTFALQNELLSVSFCGGLVCGITDKADVTFDLKQSWWWYNASVGNSESKEPSGAYVFRPNSSTPLPIPGPSAELIEVHVVDGPLVSEVYTKLGEWVSQRVRLVRGAEHVEVTYTVGAIPIGDGLGKEVVTRFSTGISNGGECYTDSNGREMIWRKRDYRASWHLNQTEPVAGNYFPVTTAIFIRDAAKQLTVLTETSQAGTGSVRDGDVELMVHRRVLKDDYKGVGEPLNETRDITPYIGGNEKINGQHRGPGLVVRGRHLLMVGKPDAAAAAWRPQADRLYMPLTPFFITPSLPEKDALSVEAYSALQRPLPPNVQIVTLAQWDEAHVLLRLAHQLGAGEDAELSKPATVDLTTLFSDMRIGTVEERGLAASISRAKVLERRVAWPVEGEAAGAVPLERSTLASSLSITLGPLQIRTFMLGVLPKQPVTVNV